MHRSTHSMPDREMLSRRARNVYSSYASQRHGQAANPSLKHREPNVLTRTLVSALCIVTLASCQSAQQDDSTNTAISQPQSINTVEVYDNPPALTIVAPEGTQPDNSAFIQVAENNLNVTQVAAEDVPGTRLVYRLQDGEDKDKFILDEETGTLRFQEVPDWEKPKDADANNNYMLLWQVISSSGDARSQFLVIQVTDLPDE